MGLCGITNTHSMQYIKVIYNIPISDLQQQVTYCTKLASVLIVPAGDLYTLTIITRDLLSCR